jgi:ABC-type transport system involved in multi-copper enzyme maturation permease subunit
MDRSRRREWLDVTLLEASNAFRSPLFECIMVFFLYMAFSVVGLISVQSQSMDLYPGPTWNGTSQIEYMLSYESTVATFALAQALGSMWVTSLFVVPLLIALTTAKAFEDGTLRTLLSYPVRRSHLLIMRTLVPFLIIGALTTLSTLLALFLMLPAPLDLAAILVLTGAYWMSVLLITSSIVLLSIVVKRMVIGAISGVALWYGLLSLSDLPQTPTIISWIINPVLMATRYTFVGKFTPWQNYWFGGSGTPLIGDIQFVFVMMALVSVILLGVAVTQFRRVEV